MPDWLSSSLQMSAYGSHYRLIAHAQKYCLPNLNATCGTWLIAGPRSEEPQRLRHHSKALWLVFLVRTLSCLLNVLYLTSYSFCDVNCVECILLGEILSRKCQIWNQPAKST